jgi:anionic cell wall polymer biosynthesis LytR-Cps2A-Psr (LCP) family protein
MFANSFLTKRNIWLGILFLFIFISGFVATVLLLKLSKIFVKNPVAAITIETTPNTYSNASPIPVDKTSNQNGVYNILLLGYGGAGHAGSLLTDSIIVVHIDTNSKKAALISIPRDLWVPGNTKINAVGSINGFQNIGPVIENVTGLHVNYFVSIDFGDFIKLIDDIGGITVQVPTTFDDPFYPITGQENNTCGFSTDKINSLEAKYSGYQLETQFTCRYEHLHFDKGPANLDGTTALKYVRSRHGDSDFARSLRQFSVLVGIENKLISLKSLGKLDQTINTLSGMVKTDLDAGTIKTLIQVFRDPGAYKVNQIQLTTENVLNQTTSPDGQYILIPKSGNFNFSGIKTYLNDNLAE